jgi:hypothetical protein
MIRTEETVLQWFASFFPLERYFPCGYSPPIDRDVLSWPTDRVCSITGKEVENAKLVEPTIMRVLEGSGRTPSTYMQQDGRLGLWKTDRSRAVTFCYTGVVQWNITQHCAWRTVGLWLPRSLTVENKTRRFGIAFSHLERFIEEANEFL